MATFEDSDQVPQLNHDLVVLANPLKTNVMAPARIKSGNVNARIPAHLLRPDLIPSSVVPPCEFREKSYLLRQRASPVSMSTREKNQVHSLLTEASVPAK
jgi:hypothetical protein